VATQKLSAASGSSTKAMAIASQNAAPVTGMILIQASQMSRAPVTAAGTAVMRGRCWRARAVAARAATSNTSRPVQAILR
jgi:hypothetical protein